MPSTKPKTNYGLHVAQIEIQNGELVNIVEYDVRREASIQMPNGLCLSPAEDKLYVTDPGEKSLATTILLPAKFLSNLMRIVPMGVCRLQTVVLWTEIAAKSGL